MEIPGQTPADISAVLPEAHMRFNLDTIDIHTPGRYATQGFPWAEWKQLRDEAPVFWYERDDIEPFWAVTRHAEVLTVSDNAKTFINGGPRLRLALKGEPELLRGGLDSFGTSRGWDPAEPPDITFMDDPRHRQTRKLSSWAFTQGCMRSVADHFDAAVSARPCRNQHSVRDVQVEGRHVGLRPPRRAHNVALPQRQFRQP
jgi:cytochrome P450